MPTSKNLNPTPQTPPNQTTVGLVRRHAEASTSDSSQTWDSLSSFSTQDLTSDTLSITSESSHDSFYSCMSSEIPNQHSGTGVLPAPTSQAAGSNVIDAPRLPPSAPDTLNNFEAPNTPLTPIISQQLTPSYSLHSQISLNSIKQDVIEASIRAPSLIRTVSLDTYFTCRDIVPYTPPRSSADTLPNAQASSLDTPVPAFTQISQQRRMYNPLSRTFKQLTDWTFAYYNFVISFLTGLYAIMVNITWSSSRPTQLPTKIQAEVRLSERGINTDPVPQHVSYKQAFMKILPRADAPLLQNVIWGAVLATGTSIAFVAYIVGLFTASPVLATLEIFFLFGNVLWLATNVFKNRNDLPGWARENTIPVLLRMTVGLAVGGLIYPVRWIFSTLPWMARTFLFSVLTIKGPQLIHQEYIKMKQKVNRMYENFKEDIATRVTEFKEFLRTHLPRWYVFGSRTEQPTHTQRG